MVAFVLDASVAVAGLAPDERDTTAIDLLDRAMVERAAVPALWHYEVANILAMKSRRGLLLRHEYEAMLTDMANLSVECDASALREQCEAALGIALLHKLSVYDAAYLELALRLKLPLATLDKMLAKAARDAGVIVLP